MKPFKKWVVARGGAYGLSKKINASPVIIGLWLLGLVTPRAEMIFDLVRKGRGAFSAEDVLRETYNRKARKAYAKRAETSRR